MRFGTSSVTSRGPRDAVPAFSTLTPYGNCSMKRFAIFCATMLATLVIATTTSHAQSHVGIGLVYGTTINDFGLEGRLRFPDIAGVSNLMIDGGLTFFFPGSGTFISADGNLHFLFLRFRNGGGISGLGGIDLTYNNTGFSDGQIQVDVNLGASISANVGPVDLFAEAKVMIGDFNRGALTGGVLIPL